MGCFDSLFIKCPRCKTELEFQSKSGCCGLNSYDALHLPIEVAVGMDGLVVKCKHCRRKWKLDCCLPKYSFVQLRRTKQEEDY